MTKQTTFFGVPVEGEISRGSTRVEQKPIEEIAPLFKAVLDDPTIFLFGWTQFTPYFNDGDVCEFSVNGLWVKTVEDQQAEESGEDDFEDWELEIEECQHPSLGRIPYRWDEGIRKYVDLPYMGPDEERYRRVVALSTAIQSAAYENAFLEKFGDHAAVTVCKDRIVIESYSHD